MRKYKKFHTVIWGILSQKYEDMASTYSMLVSDSYFKMKKHQLEFSVEGDDKSKKMTGTDEDKEKRKNANDEMLAFLNKCAEVEKNARADTPVVPKYLYNRAVEKRNEAKLKQDKRDNIEDYESLEALGGGFCGCCKGKVKFTVRSKICKKFT